MRLLMTVAPVFVAAIAVVGAQAPASQQPTTQKPAAAGNKVTVSGCLKPGTTAGTWTLDNAEMASAASAQKPAGASSGTAGTAGAKQTYTLVAKAGQDLKPHANHKIEVTGTVDKASETPRGTSGAAGGTMAKQELNVESFKMVAATCP